MNATTRKERMLGTPTVQLETRERDLSCRPLHHTTVWDTLLSWHRSRFCGCCHICGVSIQLPPVSRPARAHTHTHPIPLCACHSMSCFMRRRSLFTHTSTSNRQISLSCEHENVCVLVIHASPQNFRCPQLWLPLPRLKIAWHRPYAAFGRRACPATWHTVNRVECAAQNGMSNFELTRASTP